MSDPAPGGPRARTRRTGVGGEADRALRFGTSGWRGELGHEVTVPRLRVLVRSVADWIHAESRQRRVLVGFDTRFASRRLAEESAALLAEAGLEPCLADAVTPTPAITHALRHGTAGAGLVLTASHNPPSDHGLKIFTGEGVAIPGEATARIEALAAARMQDDAAPRAAPPQTRTDFRTPYRRSLARELESATIRQAGLRVAYDAMHGAGGGLLDAVLEDAGISVERLRVEPDSHFGGDTPDPIPERLAALREKTRRLGGLAIGIATDGDADRFGVVDGTGRVLSETQVVALLVDHLARSGRLVRGVALTHGTGSLVEKVAASHGLATTRHPVGFKHLARALIEGRAEVAGEESGGFALAESGFDKDGLLVGVLVAQLVASSGEPLAQRLAALEARFGSAACGRAELPSDGRLDRGLERLQASPPNRVGEARVVDVEPRPDLRLRLDDGGFLILRRSGTEAKLRIYAEAPNAEALRARLAAGAALLSKAADDR